MTGENGEKSLELDYEQIFKPFDRALLALATTLKNESSKTDQIDKFTKLYCAIVEEIKGRINGNPGPVFLDRITNLIRNKNYSHLDEQLIKIRDVIHPQHFKLEE